jgi:signal transduction histidine kinase
MSRHQVQGRDSATRAESSGTDEQFALLVHDLNNGLTVAQASVELVSEGQGSLTSDDRTMLGDAQVALERMRVILRQFLDVYRLEGGVMVVRRTPAVLGDIVNAAVRGFVGTSDRYRVEVDGARDLCRVDAVLVERAVRNLLLNAIRYVDRGGTIRVSGRRDGDDIVIDVGNSGPPPPADLRETLFQKFSMGETGGHGLGLYFCHLVATRHGGSIELLSLPEVRTNFRLRLPDPTP